MRPASLALIAALALPLLPALSRPTLAQPADPVVAIVDGQQIKRSDIEAIVAGLPEQYRSVPLELLFNALLERAIDGSLLYREGVAAKLQDSEEVKRRVKAAEERAVQEAFLTNAVNKALTEEKLKARYAEAVKSQGAGEEVRARHILVQTEAAAVAIIADLRKGMDFQEIAKAKSIDPSGARTGGDLGYFTREQMVPEFSEAAFAMAKGKFSEKPVKSQFGWHVILVEDKRIQAPPSFEEMKDQLMGEMSDEIAQDIIKGLRDKAQIQRFQLDGTPARN
ncbi:MAG: peptidylprolyl isomerase [Thalassobaculales bacterium]